MKRLLSLLLTLTATMAVAADRKPALELRVKSVQDLTGYLEYFGGVVGQGEQAKQFAELIKTFGGEKGVIEGVDLKRPLGAYSVVAPDVAASQIVIMLPVADEKAFVNLLKTRLLLDPKAEAGGVYKVELPNVPVPVFFRIHKDYACVTAFDAKNIDPKGLLDPKDFFAAKEQAIIALQLHLDQLPADVSKVLLGQVELKLNDEFKKAKPNPTAGDRFGQWVMQEGAMRGVKCLFEEGKTLSLRLFVEPKTDDLSLVATVTAKDGSDLAKTLKSLANKPALAALAAKAEHPIFSLALNAGVPDSLKKGLGEQLDALLAEAKKNATGDKELAGKAIDAMTPTLKAGDYEVGAALTGEIDGKLRLVSASRLTKGESLEKLARELAAAVPENVAKFEFDALKGPGGSIHKVSVLNDDLRRLYGSETAWFAASDAMLLSSFEPEGAEIKRLAALKPGTSDMLAVRIGWTRFHQLVVTPEEKTLSAEASEEVYGKGVKPGADEMALTVSGGDQLTIKFDVKGKLIEFLAKFDAKKKAK